MKGKTISHYKIVEKLGEGGMGVVYKAEDTYLDRFVALKFLPSHTQPGDDEKKRFIHEAKSASALDHPNVCTIYEIDETEDGGLFISMAFCDGESLMSKIDRGPLETEEALAIAVQTARGLHRAHESNIIHRDIKPANIMVTPRGEVKIVDFGLAKLTGQSTLTSIDSTVGTAAYMSPEQITNGTVDRRSDIFSFGVMLYEMATGVHPFRSEYYQATMYSVLNEIPRPATDINPSLPDELDWIIGKAMEKDPEKRYQTIADMLHHLEALQSGTIDTAQIAGLPTAGREPDSTVARRIRAGFTGPRVAAGTAIAIVLVLLVALLSPSSRQTAGDILFPPSIPAAKHIAVLPFTNISGYPEDQAMCDGLVEILTSKLSQLEQFHDSFWVVPASETRSGEVTTAAQAHTAFGVNLVITGSLQRFDQVVRVTINLIDAPTRRQLGSMIIDDTFSQRSILQEEAVIGLASLLNVQIQPEAQRVLAAGGTTAPGAYEFYLQGMGYLKRFDRIEEINTAIELFRRALQVDPEFALAYAALGDAHLYLYRHTENTDWLQESLTYSRRAVDIDDNISPVHVSLGLQLIEMGRFEEAHGHLLRALELDRTNFEAYRGRARAFMGQQRIPEAEATYRRAIELKPDYWAGYAELGVFYSRNGRFEEAAEQFQIVIDLTPTNASAYRNLGAVYYYLNRREEALSMFHKAIDIKPTYGVLANLGTLYYYDKEYEKAAEMYVQALELNDTDYRIWSYLGGAYRWMSPPREEQARTSYRRAKEIAENRLAVNPRDPGLLVSLASYSAELADTEQAEQLLRRAIQLDPQDVNTLFSIGFLYERLGERTHALNWIERAVQRGYSIEEIYRTRTLDSLRTDERFAAILEKLPKMNR
jgi:serine/threonine protein kinase/tetratricopeptide (TPR) repeat protein